MRIEYLADANVDGTDDDLIRLFNFTAADVQALMTAIRANILISKRSLRLNNLPFIQALNCELTFAPAETDQGVVSIGPHEFTCKLTDRGWLDMLEAMEPFALQNPQGHQWLYDLVDCRTELLLSADGKW